VKALATPSDQPSLVGALDRALADGGVGALDPAVPAALWHRALTAHAREFLGRPGKELRTRLVHAGWTLGGGAPGALPDRLPLVPEILHAGSLIIDDIEDNAELRRGAPALHHEVGVPVAINTGSWMYFWALAELAELVPAAMPLATRTLARCHQGQALDLATRIDDLPPASAPAVVDAITRLKTGALCRLAGELGAIAAGGDGSLAGAFAERMGTALQMLDDLSSLSARLDKGLEDLRERRATWAWAWLAELQPDAWGELIARRDLDALAAELYALVEPLGRLRIRREIDAALDVVGGHSIRGALADELRRMEMSYG
jgi:geranylgeranyl pyrophosphate synthase